MFIKAVILGHLNQVIHDVHDELYFQVFSDIPILLRFFKIICKHLQALAGQLVPGS